MGRSSGGGGRGGGGGGGLSSMADTKGLPALQGSEKQVAWANDIRDKKFASYKEHAQILEDANKGKGWGGTKEQLKTDTTNARAGLKYVRGQTSAKFWIDNRDRGPLNDITWLGERINAGKRPIQNW